MLRLIGSLKNKTVIDLGCGNGYLGPRFVKLGAKRVILADLSEANLKHAEGLNKKVLARVDLLLMDATRAWPLKSSSVDLVFSDMLLNEIKNIGTPMKEAYRVAKQGGLFIFAVTHPAWDLYEFAQDKLGKPRNILNGAGPYFFRGFSKFIMGTESLKPPPGEEYPEKFEIEHYQRPLQDYFEALVGAGFSIQRFIEPELPKKVLKAFPGYQDMVDHPIGAIFVAQK